MNSPHIRCFTCGRVRECAMHLHSESPPDAAKNWLKTHCSSTGECNPVYQAGIGIIPYIQVFNQTFHDPV